MNHESTCHCKDFCFTFSPLVLLSVRQCLNTFTYITWSTFPKTFKEYGIFLITQKDHYD